MATTTLGIDSSQLHSLAQRLKEWRSTRTRGQRIPEELWIAATDLARVHGLHPTASALKLNYYGLRRRLDGGQAQRKQRIPSPAFVELASPALPTRLSEPGTLEWAHASGSRLTLRLPTSVSQDFLRVVKLFLRCRP